jgi:hypothetical protein
VLTRVKIDPVNDLVGTGQLLPAHWVEHGSVVTDPDNDAR